MRRIALKKDDVLRTVKELSPATVLEIANSLQVNQMYLSGYLSALEHMEIIESKAAGTSIIFKLKKSKSS